jgi:hypothetical protein
MSKPRENDQPKNNPGDPTIEEHKKNLNIDAPVFAAVIQAKGWASGKKVPEAAFKKAVEDFLGAPMDGERKDILTIEEHLKAHTEGGN